MIGLMLRQCPCDVLGYEFGFDVASLVQCFDNGRRGSGIAQRDRQVSLPSLKADSSYGATLGALEPLVFGPVEQLSHGGAVQLVPRREIAFGGWLGKLVPGTKQLAIVATVDAITDGFAKLDRNGALQFDR